MSSEPCDTRRLFLAGTLALLPGVAFAAEEEGAQGRNQDEDLLASAADLGRFTMPGYQPGFFTASEWEFVCAACDRLIPRDQVGPGALELGVPEYIDRQLQTPYGEAASWYMDAPFIKASADFGYQSPLTPREQYRQGIPAIDALCRRLTNRPFARMPVADRDTVLKRIEEGKLTDPGFDLKTFFTSFLVKNTSEGYFGDPKYGGNRDMLSWKMIRYPGVRADYFEFASRIGPYPYGPVDIRGRQA